MMSFRILLCSSIVMLTTYIDIITACDGRSITYVATNSTSFPCPVDVINCTPSTMNELITNGTKVTRNTCSNEFLFQQGSYDAKKIESTGLRFLSKDLVIRGQDDVTITCIDDSPIRMIKASNIKIRGLKFQACLISLMESWPILSITNSIFNASDLRLHRVSSYMLLETIELINASLSVKRAEHIRITGKGSSITCKANSSLIFKSRSRGGIKVFDIKFQDCSNIVIESRSQSNSRVLPFTSNNNTWFNNSCLIFESAPPISYIHNFSINMANTTVERCSCKFIQVRTSLDVTINILLHEMTVTGINVPFIEFEKKHTIRGGSRISWGEVHCLGAHAR